VAASGVVLSAVYMLWMFQRVNYGPVTNEANARLVDLTVRERVILVPIVALTIVMGVVPNLFLRPIEPAVQRVVNQLQGSAPVQIRADAQASGSGERGRAAGRTAGRGGR
jgi:NADH-quinone oxidoreductase subunit M